MWNKYYFPCYKQKFITVVKATHIYTHSQLLRDKTYGMLTENSNAFSASDPTANHSTDMKKHIALT